MLENNANRLALGAVSALIFIMGFVAIMAFQSQWVNDVSNYREEHKMVE